MDNEQIKKYSYDVVAVYMTNAELFLGKIVFGP